MNLSAAEGGVAILIILLISISTGLIALCVSQMTAMRRLTEEDVCLLEVKCLRTDRGMDRHQQTGSPTDTQEEDATPVSGDVILSNGV